MNYLTNKYIMGTFIIIITIIILYYFKPISTTPISTTPIPTTPIPTTPIPTTPILTTPIPLIDPYIIEGIWEKFYIGNKNFGPVRISLVRNNDFYITGSDVNRLYRYLSVDTDKLMVYFYNNQNQAGKIDDIHDRKAYKIGTLGDNIYFERPYPYTPPPVPTTPAPTINSSLVTKIQGFWDYFYRNGIPIGPVTFYYIGNNIFYIDGLRNGRGLYENKRYLTVNPDTLVVTYPYFSNQIIGKLFFNSTMDKAVYFGSLPSPYPPNPPYDGFIRTSISANSTPMPTYEYSTTPVPTTPVPTNPYTPNPIVVSKISNPTSNLTGYWYLNSSVIVNYKNIINVVEEKIKTGSWWSKQWIGKNLNNINVIRFYDVYNSLMFTSNTSDFPGQAMTWKNDYTYMNGEPYFGDLFSIKRVYLNSDDKKWYTYDNNLVDFR